MSDPSIKQIQLVGGANTQMGGAAKPKRASRKVKKFEMPSTITKLGGGSTSPGTMTQLASTRVAPVEKPAHEPVGVNSPVTQIGAPVQTAGAEKVKVVLAEAKKKKAGVVLAAAKVAAPTATPKTRKAKPARKVRVSMAGLSRKINKAKTIRHKATMDSIEEIKKELQKAGLIKKESKAPDTMLRQMYADFMMLKKRSL